MEKHVVETPLGEIWLWGQPEAMSRSGPIVLFINGAFSIERPRSFDLQNLLPEATVLNAHLPGNHCPTVVSASVGVYAAAYSAAVEQLGRPSIIVGASVGALVALGMHSPQIRGRVLLEPILQTGKLWCLVSPFRQRLSESPEDAHLREFLWSVFGISEASHENRDYRHLLDGLRTPTRAMFGGEPLFPVRTVTSLPSLVDEPERDLLDAHPCVQTDVVSGVGHNVPGHAIAQVRGATRDLLDRCALVVGRS